MGLFTGVSLMSLAEIGYWIVKTCLMILLKSTKESVADDKEDTGEKSLESTRNEDTTVIDIEGE